ncbi:MAG: winged helix-turn-helix domain-containing protein [Methylocystis sp.]|uniref:winged helix-turn-helix domain-containing protein n=1 Tax=Methylocystis sp. TaxID=1911079 RepID=UPI003925E089
MRFTGLNHILFLPKPRHLAIIVLGRGVMGEVVRRFSGFTYSAQGGLQRDGARIQLGPQARQLLELLLDAPGALVTKSEIAERLWPNRTASDDSIDRCAYLLRKPLREASGEDLIATAYGRGLALRTTVEILDQDAVQPVRLAPSSEPHILDLWQTAYELAGNRTREGFSRAQEAIASAAQLDPANPSVWSLAADIAAGRVTRGFLRPAEALAMIEDFAGRALASACDHTPARSVLGWARGALQGKISEGVALLDQSVADDPLYGKARVYRSWLFAAADRLDDGLADSEEGLVNSPHDQALLSVRAWLILCAGDLERARRYARDGLDLRPDAGTLHLVMSIAYSLQGFHEQAVSATRRAVASSPDDPLQLTVLAYVLARAGADKEAEALIGSLIEDAELYAPPCFLGPAYFALGKRAQALDAIRRGFAEGCPWSSFVRIDPRLASLRAAIDQLVPAPQSETRPAG